jgi:hypothetical protein
VGLPKWTAAGLLPDGVHQAQLSDVYERLVLDAPNRTRRELLFHALAAYLSLVQDFIPHGKAWIDGGFTMAKPEEPHDVDVVIIPADWQATVALEPAKRADLLGLMTLQDVIVGQPGPQWLERVQPIGGALDGFLAHPGQTDVWRQTWSAVKRAGAVQPGETKGFVEVTW